MIQAGTLRDVIDIQAPSQVQDSAGQMDLAYTTLYSQVRAAVVPLSGREYAAARQVVAGVTTRITIRRVPGVSPACRVVRVLTEDSPPATELYDVEAVLPDAVTGKRYLTLMCVQRFAEGYRRGQ